MYRSISLCIWIFKEGTYLRRRLFTHLFSWIPNSHPLRFVLVLKKHFRFRWYKFDFCGNKRNIICPKTNLPWNSDQEVVYRRVSEAIRWRRIQNHILRSGITARISWNIDLETNTVQLIVNRPLPLTFWLKGRPGAGVKR